MEFDLQTGALLFKFWNAIRSSGPTVKRAFAGANQLPSSNKSLLPSKVGFFSLATPQKTNYHGTAANRYPTVHFRSVYFK